MNERGLQVNPKEDGFDFTYNKLDWVSLLKPELSTSKLTPSAPGRTSDEGAFGKCETVNRNYYSADEVVLSLEIEVYEKAALVSVTPQKDLVREEVRDSFIETGFNLTTFQPAEAKWLLYTWGLRSDLDGYPGGSWPTGLHNHCTRAIPEDEAFAPLILNRDGGTTVVSPANRFLLSPMTKIERKAKTIIKRGIHGSVPKLTKGETISTIFTFGDSFHEALNSWGSKLLALGKTEKELDRTDPVYNNVGHWNAYGGYYSELFSGYDEDKLTKLSEYFDDQEIPIGYFGLDLWYEYDRIGQAKSYTPDPEKYPRGLKAISEETGMPFVLHLSALDGETEYLESGKEKEEINYEAAYKKIAKAVGREGGKVAWHDWLRAEQGTNKKLRSDLDHAESWFASMMNSFSAAGLDVMLCMETAGMLLESTKYDNVLYSRSYTDYLFKQKGQLAKLWDEGEAGFGFTPPEKYLEQQILVGTLLEALELKPFIDLFISNPEHPEGFSDSSSRQSALLSSLSTGPVGVGDRAGEVDRELLDEMILPDGDLLKPDSAPIVDFDRVGKRLMPAITSSTHGKYEWKYLVVTNVSDWPGRYDFNEVGEEGYFTYNYLEEEPGDSVAGILKPAEVDYYVLVPEINQLGVVGFIDKFITMPKRPITSVEKMASGLEMSFNLPPGETYRLGVFSQTGEIRANCRGAEITRHRAETIGPKEGVSFHRFAFRTERQKVGLNLQNGGR